MASMNGSRKTKGHATPRSATALRFDAATYERLKAASEDHGLSMNWLVNRAVEDYLDRLLPASEVRFTR